MRTTARLYADYGAIFVGLLVLQFITYGYFFTTLIFTNHTFPNSWVFLYPSYKTLGEGRWFADIIFWLQGGSGVQPFQMSVAVALQSLNGLLFARFLGLEKRLDVSLAAAFLCLYPAFLDYYSFAMDHISFVIGDTFALIGILCWKNAPHSTKTAAVSGLAFTEHPAHLLKLVVAACHAVPSHSGPESNDKRRLERSRAQVAVWRSPDRARKEGAPGYPGAPFPRDERRSSVLYLFPRRCSRAAFCPRPPTQPGRHRAGGASRAPELAEA